MESSDPRLVAKVPGVRISVFGFGDLDDDEVPSKNLIL